MAIMMMSKWNFSLLIIDIFSNGFGGWFDSIAKPKARLLNSPDPTNPIPATA
jgi:hypothetical protein